MWPSYRLRNRTGGDDVQVETENEKFTVMCSRSPQNLELGNRFGRVQQRYVQSRAFIFLIKSYVLWHSRYRCRSSFLNSLFLLTVALARGVVLKAFQQIFEMTPCDKSNKKSISFRYFRVFFLSVEALYLVRAP